MDEIRGPATYHRRPPQPQLQPPASQTSHTLGPGLGLGLCGAWFLIFAGWQTALPTWLIWGFVGVGFCLVLLGLLLFGISVGNLATRRRHG